MKFFLSALSLVVTGIGFAITESGSIESCGHARSLQGAFYHGYLPNLVAAHRRDVPADTDVLKNTLNISVAPPTNAISGDNTITAVSKGNNLTEFTFRLSNTFAIGSMTLDGRTISYTRIDSSTVRANFDRPYVMNEQFNLFISYSGNAVSAPFGSIFYGTRASGGVYFETLSEPWYSYSWWPNKDDNTDKATFDINVTCANTLKAVSNGVLLGTDVVAGNKLRYRWRTSYPMSPYLASIAVSNYNTWTANYTHSTGTMPVQFWIWPDNDTTTNRNAWQTCVTMLSTLGIIYGEYPFKNEKYGIYQFTYGGGMEHQTCTGMGTFNESVNAHELGHQWWGDMITCGTWHDIWLNEGFATYTEALWSERKSGGTFTAYKNAMASRKPAAFADSVYCYNITDPNRIFSSTYTYRKGAWTLHQLRHIVGDTKFFQILSAYRNAYSYQSAVTDDFIAICEQVYGRDLSWFFNRAVYGKEVPDYRWAWQTTTSNGKNYLLVYINHLQAASSAPTIMPIDIRPTVGGVKQQKSVFNNARTQNFVIPLTGPATACTFDEDAWVLSSNVASTTFVAGGPSIVEVTPAPNSTVKSISQFKVTFHTAVTATAKSFRVVDKQTGESIPFVYSYSSTTNTATLAFAKPLRGGPFTLTVLDSVKATANSKALDGEAGYSSTLPTGNGIPGGSAVFEFNPRDLAL
ncbi:MAG: hypothetical protein J0L72_03315 [Armatimonadetes bacterium]|nr:hypothetical protein [Armatimonadota bacterium]